MIQGADAEKAAVPSEDVGRAVVAAMASGLSLSSAARLVSQQLGISRSKAYAAALAESGSKHTSAQHAESESSAT